MLRVHSNGDVGVKTNRKRLAEEIKPRCKKTVSDSARVNQVQMGGTDPLPFPFQHMNSVSFSDCYPLFCIRRSAPKSGIVHRRSDGEMIEALPGAISQAQGVV